MAATTKAPPLDEIQWQHPQFVYQNGLHSNSILWYFAESPFFNQQSNNSMIMNQSLYNANLQEVVATREKFEERLRSMHGLEFVVAQEPAETGPGMGTGVWVIREQERTKQPDGRPDHLRVIATYFVCGENIYKAPTLADILSSRLATMSNCIGNIFDSANRIQKWTPALGHTYKTPTVPRAQTLEPKEATPMPESQGNSRAAGLPTPKSSSKADLDARLAEQSFHIHTTYGGDYMDENPITGKPGDFHFASTGRKDKDRLAPPQAPKPAAGAAALPALNTKVTDNPLAKADKAEKSPRSGAPKPKRRKSKIGTAAGTPTGTTTPS